MIRRIVPLLALLALAGCSPSLPSTLTPTQIQAAMQDAANQFARERQMAAPTVANVQLGECKRDDKRPAMACPSARFSLDGSPITTKVVIWATPNPGHPYRALFLLPSN